MLKSLPLHSRIGQRLQQLHIIPGTIKQSGRAFILAHGIKYQNIKCCGNCLFNFFDSIHQEIEQIYNLGILQVGKGKGFQFLLYLIGLLHA